MSINISALSPLPLQNLQHDNVVSIAKYLLNKYLVCTIENKKSVSLIVETEAYKAPKDKASHAYNNKRTARTEVMFGQAGRSYVYLIYGIHNMLNVVTGPEGSAHAVLIRALHPLAGLETPAKKKLNPKATRLTNGPGKLCKALGITRTHNDLNLLSNKSLLYLASNTDLTDDEIVAGPRVGIAYAEECAVYPWRFRVKGSEWTSRPDVVKY